MSEKLYYKDVYQKEFDATVLSCENRQDGIWLLLDKTCFYPTGGGQPHDTGTLEAGGIKANVLQVEIENDNIWHRVDKAFYENMQVHGKIDWERRFDHMQQHAGEHMLAGCIYNLHKGVTQGLHLGEATSTIDVKMPNGKTRLSEAEILELEMLLSRRIQEDATIRCWFPSEEELKTLPLRKPSSVKENIRVVAAGNFEMVPCGGTHPSTTGQIGLVKVLATTPSKGFMRVNFVAGLRATKLLNGIYASADKASSLLSCKAEEMHIAVEQLIKREEQLKWELSEAQKEKAGLLAEILFKDAEIYGKFKIICTETESAPLKELASKIIKNENTIAILKQDKNIVFARSENLPLDMAKLLRGTGAKGGGRPDFAQGMSGETFVLEEIKKSILEELK
ncbi:MAG: alanine--tRNA ligase-related protein [Eubacteriales bacterium]|nr:alanine--tRNA ligase-related protein [Eubacteriales bacterium]